MRRRPHGLFQLPLRAAQQILNTIHYSLFTIHFSSVQVINSVDELAETGVIPAFEGEFEAGEEAEAVIRVGGVGFELADILEGHDVGKVLLQPGEGAFCHGMREADGKDIAVEIIRMVAAVEVGNVVVGILCILGDVEQLHILRRNEAGLQEFLFDEVNPAVPV